MTMLERLAASRLMRLQATPRWRFIARRRAKKAFREAYADYAESLGYESGFLKVVGWGPFKLPGEDYRMQKAWVQAHLAMEGWRRRNEHDAPTQTPGNPPG